MAGTRSSEATVQVAGGRSVYTAVAQQVLRLAAGGRASTRTAADKLRTHFIHARPTPTMGGLPAAPACSTGAVYLIEKSRRKKSLRPADSLAERPNQMVEGTVRLSAGSTTPTRPWARLIPPHFGGGGGDHALTALVLGEA